MADEIECALSKFKWDVWKHFGFAKTDKGVVICLHCKSKLKYSGNTTNMATHRKRYHAELSSASFEPPGILEQKSVSDKFGVDVI